MTRMILASLAMLILLAPTAGCECCPVTIKHDLTETYTTTVTRAVGPTTRVGARGTLPQPAPTDLNAVFIAPVAGGGNDANAGTMAAPRATIASAATLLGGAITTIVIIPGTLPSGTLLEITETADTALGARNLQAADGEYARVNSAAGRLISVSTGKINGVYSGENVSFTVTGAGRISNCAHVAQDGQVLSIDLTTAVTATIEYSVGPIIFSSTAVASTANITNCLLRQIGNDNRVIVWLVNGAASVTVTLNLTRCLFYAPMNPTDAAGFDAIEVIDLNAAGTRTFDLNVVSSAMRWATTYLVTTVYASVNPRLTTSYDYCWLAGSLTARNTNQVPSIAPTFVVTNPVNSGLPLMLVEETGIPWVTDLDVAEAARLQVAGKATPDGTSRYGISSPLKGAGLAGVDVNPWDETTTGPVYVYGATTVLKWPAKAMKITGEPQNPDELVDIVGDRHVRHDGYRWSITFDHPSGIYVNNRDSFNLIRIQQEQGSKKLYPLDPGTSLLAPIATAGTVALVSATVATITLTAPATILVPGHWSGWWVVINAKEYLITGNTVDVLTIEDVTGVGLPSAAAHSISVEYILVTNQQAPITLAQDMFTRFLRGGAWDEPHPSETRAFEFAGYSVTFYEVRRPTDGVI